ncbi:exosome RNA helicase MTR4 [Agrilus planipennis]|uniref:Exosome RNA helicase MTR4 n=1 Tax=Agrilus planipennis TaxID=224129 RepID=A0A1W4XIP1_AGRPL|nr:exosome RNA helicase MTR4 [Agrilus planipennis]
MADSFDDLFDCFSESLEAQKETAADLKNETNDLRNQLKRESEGTSQQSQKRTKIDTDVDFDDINFEELRNRIVVHEIESPESCTHEVACPPGYNFVPLQSRSTEPAKIYPFALDPFQKESILCIDNNQSVLVSAHTSAGKTVVAEYAVAVSLKNKQRVIYTTPIKALSNQKYREFYDEFKDVGLVTGDVTINPTASCLIMTTEILRNMLYRGSEIMREVGWVIFDEIHYMRDKERGVVWEETLILLPHNVHFVFLSATIPNARQFAEWVSHLHQQPCHVVYTDYRPTPLQHFIFPAGGQGIHMVVDENGTFKDENFNTAMAVLQNAGDASKGDQRGRRGGVAGKNPSETNIFKIVKMIMERNFAPVIVFSFSKKDCELYAMQMTKLDFNTTAEKQLVDEVFQNAMDVLNDEDRHLPQVENLLPLLRRGKILRKSLWPFSIVIQIKIQDAEYDWGVIVNFKKITDNPPGRKGKTNTLVTKLQVDLLLHVISEGKGDTDGDDTDNLIPKPCSEDQSGEVEVVAVCSSLITHISSVRLYCPNDLRSRDSRKGMFKAVKEVKKRFPDGLPLLNPITDMKIDESEFLDVVKKIENLEKKMFDHPMYKHPLLATEYPKYEKKIVVQEELTVARQKLMDAKSVLQLDELKCRKRVLRRLGYCTNTDVIELKGRVACELSSSDELLLTEMIFNGVFGQLTSGQCCALLSCFVCDEKSNDAPKLTEELSGPLRQMQELARRIAKISNEARLTLDEESYVEKFKPYLMDVVYAWCNGASFSVLCKMTDIFEGSIIRCMRRLEELLREMVQASKTIGSSALEEKFISAIKLIKRDIIFASSLYL